MNIKTFLPLKEELKPYVEMLEKKVLFPARTVDVRLPSEKCRKKARTPGRSQNRKLNLDSIFSKWISYDRNVCEFYMRRIAFTVSLTMDMYAFQLPTDSQMERLLETAGYDSSSMEGYIREKFDVDLDVIPVPVTANITFFMTRVLHDTFRTRSFDRLLKVHKVLLEEKLIPDHIQNERSEWNDFVSSNVKIQLKKVILDQASAILSDIGEEKREKLKSQMAGITQCEIQRLCKENTSLVDGFSFSDYERYRRIAGQMSPEAEEKVFQLGKIENEFADTMEEVWSIMDNLRDDLKVERDLNLLKQYPVGVCEGAYCEMVNGDDTIYIPIMLNVWEEFWNQSTLPFCYMPFQELEDEDDWDDFAPETNGRLASCVYGERDLMELDAYSEKGDGLELERKKVPVNTVVAAYSGHTVPALLYLRRSLISMFRKAGLSERKARDLAVVIATLQAKSDMKQFSDEKSIIRSLYPGKNETVRPSVKEEISEEKVITESVENDELIASYEDRIAELERRLHESESEKKEYRHQIISLERELQRLEQKDRGVSEVETEKSEALDSIAEENEDYIEYPYHTDKKITVYGGFESFHRELRRYLPGIRIIEPTLKSPDPEPFRGSDIVFLQINRMNHANYHAVRDAIRRSSVPCYHLNYASARKCADFIVRTLKRITD